MTWTPDTVTANRKSENKMSSKLDIKKLKNSKIHFIKVVRPKNTIQRLHQ
jgi:hypothetical protein